MTKTDHILKIVAGTAASAAADPPSEFLKQHDPALRAISEHRRAAKIFNEAVRVGCEPKGSVSEQWDRLKEVTAAPRDAMFAAGCALVTTQPTTMFGAVAMLRYCATLFDEPSIPMESNTMPETVDDEAWPCAVFRTLAA